MKIAVHAVAALMLLFTTMVSTSPVITTDQPSPKLLACLEQCKEENLINSCAFAAVLLLLITMGSTTPTPQP
ncbi:hypothetical protein LSAT2_025203 [Lamellibrachia satsuma]|nr:hypothetical protein LSAT2_025203 [Lamellibrachia satsuma]